MEFCPSTPMAESKVKTQKAIELPHYKSASTIFRMRKQKAPQKGEIINKFII